MGKRPRRKYRKDGRCSNCGGERDRPGQRYCRNCHRLYQSVVRPKHSELSAEDRRRASCRATANVAQKRGKLIPQPCSVCGSTEHPEKHHEDYSKPLEVIWFCRKHHKEYHKKLK